MMVLIADALLLWLGLQLPIALVLGRLLRRHQPPAAPPTVPTMPEEGHR